jgi:hypothetical protein
MSDLLNKIKSRGYWTVQIRPADFKERRVPRIGELEEILRRCQVSRRGWNFPHLFREPVALTKDGSIGLEVKFEHILEVWRFAQSGLFVHVSGFMDDWRDESSFWKTDTAWQPFTQLGVLGILARSQEVFQFAASLSLTVAGGPEMVVSNELVHLSKRSLVMDSPQRLPFLGRPYTAAIDQFERTTSVNTLQLQTDHRQLALDFAKELFDFFALNISTENLNSLADEALPRR